MNQIEICWSLARREIETTEKNEENMMESAPTTEAVYQGVYTLYNDTNVAEKEKASKWLTQLQNSVSFSSIFSSFIQLT